MRIALGHQHLTQSQEIDRQHAELVARANSIIDASGATAKAEVLDALRFLRDYTKVHFSAEMELMELMDYPKLEQHRRAHQYFVAELDVLRKHISAGTTVAATKTRLHYLMQDWFLQHIAHADIAFARWLAVQRSQRRGLDEEIDFWERVRVAERELGSFEQLEFVRPPGVNAAK